MASRRQFVETHEVLNYLRKKLPQDKPVVKNAQFLHLEVYQAAAQKMLTKLAKYLPNISREEATRSSDDDTGMRF